MTSEPLVSVLMTAYNREKYIASAIESVLSSTFSDYELIIVDDHSTDNTAAIAAGYEAKNHKIKLFSNTSNLGDYPNRNRAAGYAKGKYIKYLDSDDIMYPHCLEVMAACMEKFPDAGYGLSAISDINHPYPVCLSPRESYLEHFSGFGHFDRAPGSAIIKREAFEKIGGFSGERMIGDNRLWFTLSMHFPLVKMPRDLVWDRQHAEQESNSEYARLYSRLKKKVTNEALNDPASPLSEQEKIDLFRQYKIRNIKSQIKKWL